jgi:signal transduction histidine kinase
VIRLAWATRERSVRGRSVPSVLDWIVMGALLVIAVLEVVGGTFPGPPALAAAVQVAAILPVAFRRLAPVLAIAMSSAVYLPYVVAYGATNSLAQLLVGLLLLFALGRHADPRSRIAGAAIGYTLIVVQGLSGAFSTPADWTFALVFSAAAFGIGVAQRLQVQRSQALAEAAQQAQVEQEAAAEAAVQEERARIARELHDIVAHNVGLIVLQAGGARSVLETDPARARRALAQVEEIGRQTLAEMRHLVGILRTDSADERLPFPSLERVPGLVEEARSTGLDVELAIGGTPIDLPAGLELAAYRVIQEALTNVRKHAPGAHAVVHLQYGPEDLRVRVTDDGGPAGHAPRATEAANGPGHGLIGMRERVRLYGGSLEARPLRDGGFRVEARLPLGRERT